ncbi:MAG: hypothetical protein AB7G93_11730 [Bdellovibrionales bacterium]
MGVKTNLVDPTVATNLATLTGNFSALLGVLGEQVADYKYQSASQVLMPGSKIAIGTSGLIADATIYQSGDLVFDFANGTGSNGLDTGAEAPNQWYALYAVPGVGTAYILKATTRDPITQPGPAGFTKWRYLGVFKNGADLSSGQNDIARFGKVGPILNFWNPTNGNMTGIRYDGSSGPVTSFGSTINPVYGMSGGSGRNLPFNGARYGWTLTHAPSGGSSVLAAGTARFYDGSFATTGTVTFGTGNAGAAANAGYGEVWCDSTTVTAIASNSTITLSSGQMNWSLNLNTVFDPILMAKVR